MLTKNSLVLFILLNPQQTNEREHHFEACEVLLTRYWVDEKNIDLLMVPSPVTMCVVFKSVTDGRHSFWTCPWGSLCSGVLLPLVDIVSTRSGHKDTLHLAIWKAYCWYPVKNPYIWFIFIISALYPGFVWYLFRLLKILHGLQLKQNLARVIQNHNLN